MNVKWHERHVLPKRAALEQRIEWHLQHQLECACRPIPARLLEQMQRAAARPGAGAAPSAESEHSSVAETKFSNIVLAFAHQPSVSYGGKGFGSSALKFSGKIFAMLTSKGQFVVKLPRERASQLVEQNEGQYYEPGHGRLMREWLVLPSSSLRWLELAKEAHGSASGRPSRISRPPGARVATGRASKLRAGKARTNKLSAKKSRTR